MQKNQTVGDASKYESKSNGEKEKDRAVTLGLCERYTMKP